MNRFGRSRQPNMGWIAPARPGINPAGDIHTNVDCTLPVNPRAGQPGVNDLHFASDAERTAWITAHPSCTPPPPFVADTPVEATPGGTVTIAIFNAPSDLEISIDGATVPISAVPVDIGGHTALMASKTLAPGSHAIKLTGSGVQPQQSAFDIQSGQNRNLSFSMVSIPAPNPVPGTVPQPNPNLPAVQAQTGVSWGAVAVIGTLALGLGWAISKAKF